MPGAYGIHGGHAYGPPYRVRYRGEGQQEPGRGHAREQPELERRLPHRERQERGQHSSHQLADQQPYANAEHHPQERDLRANQQRPERHPGRRRAQRHRHADLTPLGLDHAAGQVERRKGGAQEQGGAEDVPELPVALRVLCDGQVRKVVLGDHDRDSEVVERRFQLIYHDVRVGRVDQRENEVVDDVIPSAQPLRRVDGREDDAEVGLREEVPFVGDHHEVLRRQAVAYVAGRGAARDPHLALRRKLVVVREVALQQHHVLSGVAGLEPAAGLDVDAVDGRGPFDGAGADDAPGYEDHAVVAGDLNLGGELQPLLGLFDPATRWSSPGQPRFEAARLREAPRAELDAEIVHVGQLVAGVVGAHPPDGGAAHPGVRPGAQRDYERDRGHLDPSAAQIAPRPPQPQSQCLHARSITSVLTRPLRRRLPRSNERRRRGPPSRRPAVDAGARYCIRTSGSARGPSRLGTCSELREDSRRRKE